MGTVESRPEPGERTWSALGAQVKAVQLYERKGWSLAAPLRPHLRADCPEKGSLLGDSSLIKLSSVNLESSDKGK